MPEIILNQETFGQQDAFDEMNYLVSRPKNNSGDIIQLTRGSIMGFYQPWAREPGDFAHYTNDYLRKIPEGFFEILGIDGGSAVICLRLSSNNEENRDRWLVHVDDLRQENGVNVVIPAKNRKIRNSSRAITKEICFSSEKDALNYLSDILGEEIEIEENLGLDEFGNTLIEIEKKLGRKLTKKEYDKLEKKLCPKRKE